MSLVDEDSLFVEGVAAGFRARDMPAHGLIVRRERERESECVDGGIEERSASLDSLRDKDSRLVSKWSNQSVRSPPRILSSIPAA